ncbi:hypothetical protein [Rhodopseudomonas sp. B29]|uniref:hypothetical protein n=1 Tax=Rhodopseudomonas sp. B29 TaxID=95607 RepID=UPI0003460AF4|nr:hypothetical protein [Rhodopseudomonas sp. B29]
MTDTRPRIAVREIALFERRVAFARPFRFGDVTIDVAAQAFVRVEIAFESGTTAIGASAEMLVPKWFDKRADRTPARTADDLRRSLLIARDLYLAGDGFDTAFGLHAQRYAAQRDACAREDIPPLAAGFGVAEIDKAILDAVLRGAGRNVFDGLRDNIAGIDARLTPDLSASAIENFLASRRRLPSVAIRHTVGLGDTIEGEGGVADPRETSGAHTFKLKLGGNPAHDAARLIRIGREFARLPRLDGVSLDANEQYADLAALKELCDRLDRNAALAPIAAKLLYIEQPMPRERTMHTPLGALASRAFIIDEADDSYDAFPTARRLGYRGVSMKSCKGIYKALLNAARAAQAEANGEHAFVTAEDLTCQAGLGVQQDLALGAFVGVTHAERNGHHYVDGFAAAPAHEAQAFLAAHPDLYRDDGGAIRLAIHEGSLSTASLAMPGFASGAQPDWASLSPLAISTSELTKEHA